MAKRRPRDIGTAAETATVTWLRPNGFPHAERRALRSNQDAGDITGTPGIAWEVKAGQAAINASDADIERWLADTAKQTLNAGADIGVLIQRRRGKASPGNWWAWTYLADLKALADETMSPPLPGPIPEVLGLLPVRMLLSDLTQLLRHAGYGQPL